MNLSDIETKTYILALFIRDDGERFLLGSGAYEFKKDQEHFVANTYYNDIVEVQGNDGVFLAGQVRRPQTQTFEGYIGDSSVAKTDVETYRKAFIAFFRKNYYYKVVYIFQDGTAIQRRKGFIVNAPEVKELYQLFPEYSVGLSFEDINYYNYAEDSGGEEIYGKSATINLSSGGTNGGLIWDAVGVVWDAVGATWEDSSSGGPTTVTVDSIDRVYPVWVVIGPAQNPQLTNLTTGIALTYTGNVTVGSTLEIDMFNKTAKLNGTSVVGNVGGEWMYFDSGNNRVTYTAVNNDANPSTIQWNEVVG
jgi:hypothetical protein